ERLEVAGVGDVHRADERHGHTLVIFVSRDPRFEPTAIPLFDESEKLGSIVWGGFLLRRIKRDIAGQKRKQDQSKREATTNTAHDGLLNVSNLPKRRTRDSFSWYAPNGKEV